MVTDSLLQAVKETINNFETEKEKQAGQAIFNMLTDFEEDAWNDMNEEQKTDWVKQFVK